MKNKYKEKNLKQLYYLPITIWLTIFFMIPTLIIVYFSILKKGVYGGIKSYTSFSLDAYRELLTPELMYITYKTLEMSIIITFIVVIISIPTAYYISRSKHKNLWLLLIVIPFWTNFLVRIFAVVGLIGNNGIINRFFMTVFNLQNPIPMLYNKFAVILISVYIFMPYAILPLYSAIEKFDFSLIDAARDLGATKNKALLKVFVPGIKGGIITAIILTFIPAIGSYAVPDIVGGTDGIMLGNIIANKMFVLRDWPSAAAISTVFIIITIFTLIIGGKNADKQ
ncbi:ABC transporter permease [Oceanivirga miroungae]|uniref:Putrescine transport system permease protein PotH n=1 Tax=Oceanivirga miroungae TaxID=1130046 RepID=A0A6I8M7Y3_9FUSO|nr:ABC transporter permease [Oceanivirga miroungae]VWL85610.1 Putrescine transport system permease protein PotH [Oceanivirga miroungae]